MQKVLSIWLVALISFNFEACLGFQRGRNLIRSIFAKDFQNIISLRMNQEKMVEGSKNRRDFIVKGVSVTGALGLGTIGKRFLDGSEYLGAPDLGGKNVVITGGNTGLGKESAIRLAKLGAEVCIACRSQERAEQAVADIKFKSGSEAVSWVRCELASLNSIEKCAQVLNNRYDKIDVLLNNAGVMALPKRKITEDGFEYQFGVNHLGHFHLTNQLMKKILAAPKPRIVNLSSTAHTIPPGVINFDDVMGEKKYEAWVAYGQSKLANVLFTKELQKRLNEKSAAATVMCCHPGVVRTELGRNLDIPPYALPLLLPLFLITKSPEMGAQTQIFLSADPSVENVGGGKYYDNCKEVSPSTQAQDMETAIRLWELSENLTSKFII